MYLTCGIDDTNAIVVHIYLEDMLLVPPSLYVGKEQKTLEAFWLH